jgi:membrane protease YdiL (CAAX protease family)
MKFFKNRNSKRSDIFVLLCGFIALVFIFINFIVKDQLFDNDFALTVVCLILIYFLTSKDKVEQKFKKLGLDKIMFFLMVFLIGLFLLMTAISIVIE